MECQRKEHLPLHHERSGLLYRYYRACLWHLCKYRGYFTELQERLCGRYFCLFVEFVYGEMRSRTPATPFICRGKNIVPIEYILEYLYRYLYRISVRKPIVPYSGKEPSFSLHLVPKPGNQQSVIFTNLN